VSLLHFSTDLDKIQQQQQQQCIQIAAVNVSFMKIGTVKVAARRGVLYVSVHGAATLARCQTSAHSASVVKMGVWKAGRTVFTDGTEITFRRIP